ncbi:hypothetical protein [Rheinheimera sp. WS51]|uniref:hypothetical protein n=1 Tax=Rheinheimera sp. WS51 TaxID=3425886 RepID=UPI003D95011C
MTAKQQQTLDTKKHTGVDQQAEDPLAAIKLMRLQQLAVCKLKTAAEMQAMQEKKQAFKEQKN